MKIYLSLLALAFNLFTHHLSAQTTEEEYKYLSKGYQIQLEAGLDMKKGYYLTDMGSFVHSSDEGVREVGFLVLYRESNNSPAGIIMSYQRTDVADSKVIYTGIPMPNSDFNIMQKFKTEVSTTLSSNFYQARAITNGLMQLFAKLQFNQEQHEKGILSDTANIDLTTGMTEVEYNYLNKGYQLQIEGGLDDKKGYHFKDVFTSFQTNGSEQREFYFKNLIREESNTITGTILNYKRTDVTNGVNGYIAIPNYTSFSIYWDRCNENVKASFQSLIPLRAFMMSLFEFNVQLLETNYTNNYWAEINKKKGISGRYIFSNENYSTIVLIYPDSNGSSNVRIETASQSMCMGNIEGTIKFTKTGEGELSLGDCKINLNIKKDICIIVETNCFDYHGASCSFDGTLIRK